MRTTSAAQTPRIPQSDSSVDDAARVAQATNAATIESARNGPSPAPMRIPSSANTAPFNGCMSAKSGHRSAASSSTDASPVNARGSTSASRSMSTVNTPPSATDSQIIRSLAAVGVLRPAGAELAPDDDLTCDRDRVEDEREEDPELERDLVRADRGLAEACGDRAGEDERAA